MLPGQVITGQGKISYNGRQLASVYYRIQLWRFATYESGLTQAAQSGDPVGDLATGSIVVDSGDTLLPAGDICTLTVETGHECKVYLDPQGIGSGYYRLSVLDIADLR